MPVAYVFSICRTFELSHAGDRDAFKESHASTAQNDNQHLAASKKGPFVAATVQSGLDYIIY